MRKIMLLLMFALFIAGCNKEYYWNDAAGKAGEGRCYQKLNPGADVIVPDSKCGR